MHCFEPLKLFPEEFQNKLDEIPALKTAFDAGLISQEDFDAARAKALGL